MKKLKSEKQNKTQRKAKKRRVASENIDRESLLERFSNTLGCWKGMVRRLVNMVLELWSRGFVWGRQDKWKRFLSIFRSFPNIILSSDGFTRYREKLLLQLEWRNYLWIIYSNCTAAYKGRLPWGRGEFKVVSREHLVFKRWGVLLLLLFSVFFVNLYA